MKVSFPPMSSTMDDIECGAKKLYSHDEAKEYNLISNCLWVDLKKPHIHKIQRYCPTLSHKSVPQYPQESKQLDH